MVNFILRAQTVSIERRIARQRTDPWFSTAQPGIDGHYVPEPLAVHVKDGSAEPAVGDTIWLVSQLTGPMKIDDCEYTPPALLARIDVGQVAEGKPSARGRVRQVTPAPSSQYFRLADGTSTFTQLAIHPPKAKPTEIEPLMQSDGSMSKSAVPLQDDQPLQDLAKRLQTTPYDYVSYRQMDGTRAAFELVIRLMKEGHVVFFDRWGMPAHLAECREVGSDPALETFLAKQLAGAHTVWQVDSPAYRQAGSYSAGEADQARELGRGRDADVHVDHGRPDTAPDPWQLDYLPTAREKASLDAQHRQAAIKRRRQREEAERLQRNPKAKPATKRAKAALSPEKQAARRGKPKRIFGLGIKI